MDDLKLLRDAPKEKQEEHKRICARYDEQLARFPASYAMVINAARSLALKNFFDRLRTQINEEKK